MSEKVDINKFIDITVTLGNRVFKIKVEREQEQLFRIAADLFKNKYKYYENEYDYSEDEKSRETILSLAGYDIAVGFLRYINRLEQSILEEIQ
ncbi:MAG: cell division protein ZapA [Prevotellaceae bacterium]|jgi:hypothetical protein|nr:cell division protein ZapA [Prevotellaceae bacterium]